MKNICRPINFLAIFLITVSLGSCIGFKGFQSSLAAEDSADDAPGEGEWFNPSDVTPEFLNFNPQWMCIEGDTAFITGGDGLHIFDFSDPANPERLNFVEAPGSCEELAVRDGYAYIPSLMDVFYTVDVEPVESAYVVGSCALPEVGRKITVSGNYAYVTCGNPENGSHGNTIDSFEIIDISDPESPEVTGSIETVGSSARKVRISGDYAYVAAGGLEIYDVRNPSSPQLVQVYGDYGFEDFEIANGFIYVATSDYFHVVDISSPETDLPDETFEFFRSSSNISISGNYAFVTGTYYDEQGSWHTSLDVLDISIPGIPENVGRLNMPIWWKICMVAGEGYLYMVDSYTGIRTIKITDPGSPQIIAEYPSTDHCLRVAAADGFAYCLNSSGIVIVDVDPAESAHIVKRVELAHNLRFQNRLSDIDIHNGYAYVRAQIGLLIIDIDPVESAYEVAMVSSSETYDEFLALTDGYAFIYDRYGGIEVIDIDPPENAHTLGSVDMPEHIYRVFAQGNYIYAKTHNIETQESKLLALRNNLPESLDVVGEFDAPWEVIGIDATGRYGFVSDIVYWRDPHFQAMPPNSDFEYFFGTVVIDPEADDSIWNGSAGSPQADPEDMLLSRLDFWNPPLTIPILGGFGYVFGGRELSEEELAEFTDPETGLYLHRGPGLLNIVDLSQPESIRIVDSFDIFQWGVNDFTITGGYLYAAHHDLKIYDLW